MSGKHEKHRQIFPYPRVDVKEWDVDGYPAAVIVKMGDNTTIEYQRKINQPHPCFKAAMDSLEKFSMNFSDPHRHINNGGNLK